MTGKSSLSQKLRFATRLLIGLMATLGFAHQAAAQLRYVPVGIPSISISSGSFIVAKEAGFYKEEGLNVDLVVMRGAPAIQGLIGGTVPFASSGGAGLLPDCPWGAAADRIHDVFPAHVLGLFQAGDPDSRGAARKKDRRFEHRQRAGHLAANHAKEARLGWRVETW